ncbi:MAG: cyclase family protein [Bacteroidia bacterium]
MQTQIQYANQTFTTDLEKGIDISIPVGRHHGPEAFYLQQADFTTVEAGGFVGNVARGGSCNVENICFNAHGNGTHTECAGHISKEPLFIKDVLQNSFFLARLISVEAKDAITKADLENAFPQNMEKCQALIVRTIPNDENKKTKNYSGTNPAYFSAEAINYINELGILHLLTDLPSIDKEDDTKLLAHHAFFQLDGAWNLHKTITEMIFVPNAVADGLYFLNLQTAAFESDASPSKPLLYKLHL